MSITIGDGEEGCAGGWEAAPPGGESHLPPNLPDEVPGDLHHHPVQAEAARLLQPPLQEGLQEARGGQGSALQVTTPCLIQIC